VPVVGDPRDVRQAEVDGDVAGDRPSPVERLAEDHVVDVGGGDPRAGDGLADRDLAEAERVDVDQGALAGPSDRGAGGGDDDGIGHGALQIVVALHERAC
jgi:hypothetical protein